MYKSTHGSVVNRKRLETIYASISRGLDGKLQCPHIIK